MKLSRRHIFQILSLIALTLPFCLFQNMASLEDGDIRDWAPEKPATPKFFLPGNPSAGSPSELGNLILDHNFRDQLKQLETDLGLQGERWGVSLFGDLRSGNSKNSNGKAPGVRLDRQGVFSSFHISWVNPQLMRLSLENEFRMTLDLRAGDPGALVAIRREISSTTELGLDHKTDLQKSSIWLNYKW